MSDEQRDPWQLINQRVEYHRQARWKEIRRWDDPPRVRVQKGRPGRRVFCRDITISDDGSIEWRPVDCASD